MRVVADSHILIFYLFMPDKLSEPALEALGEAEGGMGDDRGRNAVEFAAPGTRPGHAPGRHSSRSP